MLILLVDNAAAATGGFRFLLWRPSATATALGGSGVASYNSGFSLYYNPALLTECKGIDAAGSYVRPLPFFENIIHSYDGAVFRLDSNSALGVSGNLSWRGGQLFTSSVGSALGADAGEYFFTGQFKIAYAREIMRGISLGASASLLQHKFFTEEINVGAQTAGPSVRTLLADLGIYATGLLPAATLKLSERQPSPINQQWGSGHSSSGVSAGVSLLHLGPKVTIADAEQAFPPPSLLLAGVSWFPVTSNWLHLRLAAELEKQLAESSQLDHIRSGAELQYSRLLVLRGGYVLDTDGYRNSYPSWGAGLLFKYGSINVSRYNASLMSSWHFDLRFSLELS
jgi:hypothetical protein